MAEHTPGEWKVFKGAVEGDDMRCAVVVQQGKMQYLIATIENGAPGDFCETEEANAELIASAPKMKADLADMQRTFDLMWAADQRAIKRWQAAHPGNDLTWPDRSKLTEWLLERQDAAFARLRAHALSRCPDRATGATKYTHCDECDTRWNGDQPEQHKPTCILSEQPQT